MPPEEKDIQSEQPILPIEKQKRVDLRTFVLTVFTILIFGMLFIAFAYIAKFPLPYDPSDPTSQTVAVRYWFYELGHFLLLEIGLGCITGCIIAITIETFMRIQSRKEHEEQKQEISKNVFFALFRTTVTDELVKEMYAALFLPKFVREHLVLKYKFTPLPGQDDVPLEYKKLLIHQTISFRARNVTDQRVSYTMSPHVEVLLEHVGCASTFKEFLMRPLKSDPTLPATRKIHLSGNEIAGKVRRDGIRCTLEEQKMYAYPGECLEICIVVEKIGRYYDTDSWVTRHSAQDLKLIVELTEELHMDFSVGQAHRQKLIKTPAEKMTTATSHVWLLEHAILPYQGVMLWWRPEEIVAEQAAQCPAPTPDAKEKAE